MRPTWPPLRHVFGVDFSGAKLAGRTTWVAEVEAAGGGLRLKSLDPLGRLAGGDERETCLPGLADAIRGSEETLWCMDFPFGLPVELEPHGWHRQLARVRTWDGTAIDFGRRCVERARRVTGTMHPRRTTDREAKAPFDCTHYRIIHQTFHGMRDVLAPLSADPGVCVLPFEFARLRAARAVVCEVCPSSVLKHHALPHQNYKQPAGGPIERFRLKNRQQILCWIEARCHVSTHRRRVMLTDPGGDALDAVLCAVGGRDARRRADLATVAAHPRYRREGWIMT